MDILYEISRRLITNTSLKFMRSQYALINWDARLIEISGARGVGKTTLMLQYIKSNYDLNDNSVLYISVDDPFFYNNSLIDTVDTFVKYGGRHIFIDEIQKYTSKYEEVGWSGELKACYDRYPLLNIVYSGSSIIQLLSGIGDLSRRISPYNLLGLSLREYMNFNNIFNHKPLSLQEVIDHHEQIAREISSKIIVLKEFSEYLRSGYYAFYNENPGKFYDRIKNILTVIMESDIPAVTDIPFVSIQKMKRLLSAIASSSPDTPNLSKVGKEIGITDHRTLLRYISYMEKAEIVRSLSREANGNMILRKPEKLLLNNTNLCYALQPNSINIGTLREIFFLNQVSANNSVLSSETGDFLVNEKYIFEIGGKNKTSYQIKDQENAFLALDNIETGIFNKIPLWMFGLLY